MQAFTGCDDPILSLPSPAGFVMFSVDHPEAPQPEKVCDHETTCLHLQWCYHNGWVKVDTRLLTLELCKIYCSVILLALSSASLHKHPNFSCVSNVPRVVVVGECEEDPQPA